LCPAVVLFEVAPWPTLFDCDIDDVVSVTSHCYHSLWCRIMRSVLSPTTSRFYVRLPPRENRIGPSRHSPSGRPGATGRGHLRLARARSLSAIPARAAADSVHRLAEARAASTIRTAVRWDGHPLIPLRSRFGGPATRPV
jgi:hypothetical protein